MRLKDMMRTMVHEYLAAIALVERYPHWLPDVGGMLAFLVNDLNARVNRIAQGDPNFPLVDSGFAEMEGWPVVVDAVAAPARKERPNRQLKSCWQQSKELVSRLGVGTRSEALIRATPGKLSGDLRTWLLAEFQHWKCWAILEFIQMNLKEGHRMFSRAFRKSCGVDFPKPPYQCPDWTVKACAERFLKSDEGGVHARKLGASTARDEAEDCLIRWLPKLKAMESKGNSVRWSEFTGLLISPAEFERILKRPPPPARSSDS